MIAAAWCVGTVVRVVSVVPGGSDGPTAKRTVVRA